MGRELSRLFFDGIMGADLSEKFFQHAKKYGALIRSGTATKIEEEGKFKLVHVENREKPIKCKVVIVGFGCEPKKNSKYRERINSTVVAYPSVRHVTALFIKTARLLSSEVVNQPSKRGGFISLNSQVKYMLFIEEISLEHQSLPQKEQKIMKRWNLFMILW